MYVEDEPVVRSEFGGLLGEFFGRVDFAGDGQEGLELFSKGSYDIVISDIRMPKMDGIELAEKIMEKKGDQIIVITSAHNDAEYLERLIEIGVEKFLQKPLETTRALNVLLKIVHTLDSRRELENYRSHLEEMVKENTRELQAAYQKIEKLDQNKIEFLKYLSHEFNTPLQHISAYGMFETDDLDDEEKRAVLKIIESGYNRLNGLVKSVIEYFELAGKSIELSPVRLSVAEHLQKVFSGFADEIQNKDIELSLDAAGECEAVSDKRVLDSMLMILADNAVKYCNEGGKIAVRAEGRGGEVPMVVITICDSGIGIDDETHPLLFQPFALQEHIRKNSKGYGLNLCKAKVYTEALGGRLEIRSRGEEKGTSVELSIPVEVGVEKRR